VVRFLKTLREAWDVQSRTKAKKAGPASVPAVQAIARQLKLDLLTRGRVVQIGLGGIGLPLARLVVQFLASFREQEIRVVLCDGDAFEPDNLYRMDVPGFGNKAAAVAGELAERFGRSGLHLRWVPEYLTAKHARKVITEGDLVLAAVDNHFTRKLVSDRCRRLKDVALISGGNDGVEDGRRGTYGNVQVYARVGGRDRHPPLDRFHPEIARPADRNPADLDCLELAGAHAPQISLVNAAVATAMAGALLRLLMSPEEMYDELALDIFEGVSVPHRLASGRG
jgi:hypothetical protein